MSRIRKFFTPKKFKDIQNKFAKRGELGVPQFVSDYEKNEPFLATKIKEICKNVAVNYTTDLIKMGINNSTAYKLQATIETDMYIIALFSFLLADKSHLMLFEEEMHKAWGDDNDDTVQFN